MEPCTQLVTKSVLENKANTVTRRGPKIGWKLSAWLNMMAPLPSQICTQYHARDPNVQGSWLWSMDLSLAVDSKFFVRVALCNEDALPKIHKVNIRPEKHMMTVPMNITNCTIIACSELFVARYELRRGLVGLWRHTE